MPSRRLFLQSAALASLSSCLLPTDAPGAPTTTAPATPELLPHWHGMTSADQWPSRREELKSTILAHLGTPSTPALPDLKPRILSDESTDDYRHLTLSYTPQPDDEIRAHLLIPPKSKRRHNAAVLCLHGTTPSAKDSLIRRGPTDKPNRDLARFLSLHGFVTLSPDHACSGDRLPKGVKPYDSTPFYKVHPNWSMVGKAAFDASRALDILTQFDEVDPARLGALGHSLGGQGAAFVAAFDERVKCAVNSCGLTTWSQNPKLSHWSRDSWYVYFPHLKPYIKENKPLPFDLYEFVALAAPRPFLNIFGLNDMTYGPVNHLIPQVAGHLQSLYNLLGQPANLANFLPGMPHDVPDYSRALIVSWLETHLATT